MISTCFSMLTIYSSFEVSSSGALLTFKQVGWSMLALLSAPLTESQLLTERIIKINLQTRDVAEAQYPKSS